MEAVATATIINCQHPFLIGPHILALSSRAHRIRAKTRGRMTKTMIVTTLVRHHTNTKAAFSHPDQATKSRFLSSVKAGRVHTPLLEAKDKNYDSYSITTPHSQLP